jgi:glycosyltransferase involved in cell wall biosynthesis
MNSTLTNTEPLRILMGVPQYPFPVVGGLEKQAHELAATLVQRGHVVNVLSGRLYRGQPAESNVNGVVVHRLPWPGNRYARWFLTPILLWRAARRLLPSVDVVHTHVFSGFGLFLILLAGFYRKSIIVKLPNVGESGLPGLTRGVLGRLRQRIFLRADTVVAMSSASLAELQAVGYERRRVLTTPNGIRVPCELAMPSRPEARRCRLAFAGRLEPQKGLFDLLTAFKKIVAEISSDLIELHIFGDGPLRAELESFVVSKGLAKNVQINGHVDGLIDILVGFDAFVLPSYREGNSNAILEAMALGLPVISTRTGGTPMLVGDIGAFLLHEPGDVAELTRLLRALVESPNLRASTGAAMRERVQRHFDIERVADTYIAAYRLLAAGRGNEVHTVSNPIVITGS